MVTLISACLHHLKKCANRGNKGSLAENIDLEMLEQKSNQHSLRTISTWDQNMLWKYEVNNKLEDVNSNASQEAIDQKRSANPSMTVLDRFEKEIVENNFWLALGQ